MKLFLVLLAVGLASCDITCPPALRLDPCAIKGASLGSGLNLGASDILPGSSSYGCQDLSAAAASNIHCGIPPAVASGDSLGLDGAYSGIYPGAPGFSAAYSAGDLSAYPALCARHRIVSRVRPVVDECISNVPIVKKYVRNQEETFTRQVPVVTKHVTTHEEKRIRHVPIIKKNARTVVEHQTHHVPIVKSRVVPVIQHYTQHVPVTRQYCRPVVDEQLTHVPVVERRCRPYLSQSVHHVPVTERRFRPVLETKVVNVPVKQKIVRNLVEQRVHKSCEPCEPCEAYEPSCFGPYSNFGPYPIGSAYPSVGEIYGTESALAPVSSGSFTDSPAILTNSKVTSKHHAHTGCTCFCN